MRKLIVAGIFVLALGIVTASWAHGRHSEKVLTFKTNVGVVPPYTGSPANAALTRGIQGAGAAWQIDEARGTLRGDGDLDLKVKGLVLVSTGQNPLATLQGDRQLPVDRQQRTGGDSKPVDRRVSGDHARRRRGLQRKREPAEPVHRADRVRHDGGRHASLDIRDGVLSSTSPSGAPRGPAPRCRSGIARGQLGVDRLSELDELGRQRRG